MKGIVLFDGVCNFCDHSVQLIMKHDKKQYFQFASIQSEVGQQLVKQYHLENVDSVILIENDQAYIKSDAPLKIIQHFPFYWKPLLMAKILPKSLRNRLYDFVAKNRYTWFGQKDVCRIPTPEERERFL